MRSTMLVLLVALIVVLFLAALLPIQAQTQCSRTFIADRMVLIRLEPSTDTPVVDLAWGVGDEEIAVCGSTQTVGNEVWVAVISPNEVSGWIMAESLPSAPQSQLQVGSRAITETNLSLRSGHGINFTRLRILDLGTELDIVGGPTEADNYVWWQVSGSGITGWSAEKSLLTGRVFMTEIARPVTPTPTPTRTATPTVTNTPFPTPTVDVAPERMGEAISRGEFPSFRLPYRVLVCTQLVRNGCSQSEFWLAGTAVEVIGNPFPSSVIDLSVANIVLKRTGTLETGEIPAYAFVASLNTIPGLSTRGFLFFDIILGLAWVAPAFAEATARQATAEFLPK